MTTINTFDDVINLCDNIISSANDSYNVINKYVDIHLIFKKQPYFFNKNIKEFEKIDEYFRVDSESGPSNVFNTGNIETIINSNNKGIYIYNGENNVLKPNTYLIISETEILMNVYFQNAEKDLQNILLKIEKSDTKDVSFDWQLLKEIFRSDNIKDSYSKFNRIYKKLHPVDSIVVSEKIKDLQRDIRRIKETLETIDEIPKKKRQISNKIKALKTYIDKNVEDTTKMIKNAKKKIPRDLEEEIKKVEKDIKSASGKKLTSLKTKREEYAVYETEAKNIKIIEGVIKEVDNNVEIATIIENLEKDILNLENTALTKSELETTLSLEEKQLRELNKQLSEIKSVETESTTKVTIPYNLDWLNFEMYLFDKDAYSNYVFGLNCCQILNLLLCVCVNKHLNNDTYMLFLLNKINNLNIPEGIEMTQVAEDKNELREYILDQGRSHSCLVDQLANITKFYESNNLNYKDEKLEILAVVQKLWFYLNEKINSISSQTDSAITIKKTNGYNKAPLVINNNIESYMTESTIKRLLTQIEALASTKKPDINELITIISDTYELMVTENYINLYSWNIVNYLIKIPLIVYNYEISDEILFKLCEIYGKWFKLCSITNKIHIYKYSYYLLINKNVQRFELTLPTLKNTILYEFYNDINSFPITDIDCYEDVELIKNYILDSDIKIWYNTEQELNMLNDYLLKLTEIKTVFTNLMLYDNINYESHANEHIRKMANNIMDDRDYLDIINAKSKEKIVKDDCVIIYHKQRHYTKEIINLLFPNLKVYEESNMKLTSLLSLIQIIHSCKNLESNSSLDYNYPTAIAQCSFNKNYKIELTEQIINNEVYVKIDLPDFKAKNVVPTELTNTEYNLTACNNIYNKYLNSFIRFIQSEDSEYIKSNYDVIPFVKHGYNINDNKEPIRYEEGDKIIQNDSIYTKNKLLNNLLINDETYDKMKKIFDKIHENKINLEKIEYNTFIFNYWFLTNCKNLEEDISRIITNNLFSVDSIKKSEMTKTQKLMCICNCIKYYHDNSEKLYAFCNLLNEIVNKNKFHKNEKYIVSSVSNSIILKNNFYLLKLIDDGDDDDDDDDDDDGDVDKVDNDNDNVSTENTDGTNLTLSSEVSTDGVEVSTDGVEVSTDGVEVSTDGVEVSTDGVEVSTDETVRTVDKIKSHKKDKITYKKDIIINSKDNFNIDKISDVYELIKDDEKMKELTIELKKILSDSTEEYWKNEKYSNDINYETVSFEIKRDKDTTQRENKIELFMMEHISSFLSKNNLYNYIGLMNTFVYNDKIKENTTVTIQPFESIKYFEFSQENRAYIKGEHLFDYYSVNKDDENSFLMLLNKRFTDVESGKIVYEKISDSIVTKYGKKEYTYTESKPELINKKNNYVEVNYERHSNKFDKDMIHYDELKNMTIGSDYYVNKMTFLTNYYDANIVESNKLEFNSPYFIANNYINKYFIWKVENDKFIGRPKYSYPKYSLSIDLSKTDYVVKKIINGVESDEQLVSIDEALLKIESSNDINFLKKMINIIRVDKTVDFESIFLWKMNNKIRNIDMLSIKTFFNFKNDSWYINDIYKIINSEVYLNKTELTRWVSFIDNFILVQDTYDDIYIYTCPFTAGKNKRVCENYMQFKIKINTELILEELNKLETAHYIIKLNSTTFFPIITNKSMLEVLFYNYLLSNKLTNIFDLLSMIRKYDINYTSYCTLLDEENEELKKYFYIKIPSVNLNKQIKNKFKLKNYLKKYKIIKDVEKYKKMIEFKYYFNANNIYPSLTEYWIYALYDNELLYVSNKTDNEMSVSDKTTEIKVSDVMFTIFYNKILENYRSKNQNDVFKEVIEHYERQENMTINPMEFYYQYLLGFFAREEQNALVNDIIKDITNKQIKESYMVGGYFSFSKYFENELEYETDSRAGHIHSLIMGGGKTKMITPLVIVKYLLENSFDSEANGNHIYLVLPEYLVAQSYEYLSQIFNMYYPIKVNILQETRGENKKYKKYSDTVSKVNKNELQVFVMSDLTMKAGFLNNYETIKSFHKSHAYIFDEADTIIEPLISELNYPEEDKMSLYNLSTYFDLIYKILDKIFNDNEVLLEMMKDHEKSYELTPHFNLIELNAEIIEIIKKYVIEQIINYYDSYSSIKEIFELVNSEKDKAEIITKISSYIKTEEGEKQIPLLYTLFNFINEVLPVVLNKINRKDYGLVTTEIPDNEKTLENLVIVPFTYVDTPKIGSSFSNPLLTMSLTIIDYIVQVKPLNKFVLYNLVELINNKYNGLSNRMRTKSELILEYIKLNLSVNITDLKKLIFAINEDDMNKLRASPYFVKMICRRACETITFNLSQSNIAGIDLFMNMNVDKKSGFTGTPNISKFYDLEKKNEIKVIGVSEKTQKLINDSLLGSTFSKVEYNKSQEEYLENVIRENLIPGDYNCNTLIDVGAVCVGITVQKIYDIVKKYNNSLKQFIYWNKEDIPHCIDIYGNDIVWNGLMSEGNEMFYYYDNKHTTGIDAVIPMKSLGLVLLGKNSRYRDVVQGIYRMRKLNVSEGHKIRFILNNKIYDYVKKILKHDLTINDLIEWFNIEESNFGKIQQNIMTVQNVRSLRRYFVYPDDTNIFKIDNAFKYPQITQYDERTVAELIMGIKTYTNMEMLEKINEILKNTDIDKSNILEFINSTQKYLESNNAMSGNNISQSQEQTMSLEQTQNLQLNIEENIVNNELLTDAPILRSLNTFEKYFVESDYYTKIFKWNENSVYKSAYISKNLKIFTTGPYFMLYSSDKYFLIPFIEGMKLIENMSSISSTLECVICDTDGVIYYNNLSNNTEIITIGKILFKKVLDTIYINEDDYVTITNLKDKDIFEYIKNTKSKTEKFNEFKAILDIVLVLEKFDLDIIDKYNKNPENRSDIYTKAGGNAKIILNFFTDNGNYFNDAISMVGGNNNKYKKYKIISANNKKKYQ